MAGNSTRVRDTTSRKARVEKRRRQVSTLMLMGYSTREIADQLNPPVTHVTVWKDEQAIRQQWRDQAMQATGEWVSREIAKLELLERQMYPVVLDRTLPARDRRAALDGLLRCMERRAKLLGLDAPDRLEVTALPVDVIEAAVEELEREARLGTVAGQAALPAGAET